MPKRSKDYPKPTFSFGDDGVPTIHIGQTIQLLTEDGRDWYASIFVKTSLVWRAISSEWYLNSEDTVY